MAEGVKWRELGLRVENEEPIVLSVDTKLTHPLTPPFVVPVSLWLYLHSSWGASSSPSLSEARSLFIS